MWNELRNPDFLKAVVHTPLLVDCVLPNGLVSSPSKGHLLIQLDDSVLMLISVYGLLYLFANHDSKNKTLDAETLHMSINHKLNKSWQHRSDCVGSLKASVSQPLSNLRYYMLHYLEDCKGNKEYGRRVVHAVQMAISNRRLVLSHCILKAWIIKEFIFKKCLCFGRN